jgi:cytochrome c biogenesis protein CcmG/thiol:disulfide interchange protein DsbE
VRTPRRLAAAIVLGAIVVVVAVIALNVPLGGSATGSPGTLGSPLLNKPAPDFTLTALDGRTVHLADYRGRPVIVNFWASWCIPCRDEFPQFVTAKAQHATDGLEVLGIVRQDSADAAAAFASSHGADWPLLMDPDEAAWKAYVGLGVPSTYFIDRAGVVRATSLGPITATSLPIQLAKIL